MVLSIFGIAVLCTFLSVGCSDWNGAKFTFYKNSDKACSETPKPSSDIYLFDVCSEGDYEKFAMYTLKGEYVILEELCDSKCEKCNRTKTIKLNECFYDIYSFSNVKPEVVKSLPTGDEYFYEYTFLSKESCESKNVDEICEVSPIKSTCGDCHWSYCPGSGGNSYLDHCTGNYTTSFYKSKDCSGDPYQVDYPPYKCFNMLSKQSVVRTCDVLI